MGIYRVLRVAVSVHKLYIDWPQTKCIHAHLDGKYHILEMIPTLRPYSKTIIYQNNTLLNFK